MLNLNIIHLVICLTPHIKSEFTHPTLLYIVNTGMKSGSSSMGKITNRSLRDHIEITKRTLRDHREITQRSIWTRPNQYGRRHAVMFYVKMGLKFQIESEI